MHFVHAAHCSIDVGLTHIPIIGAIVPLFLSLHAKALLCPFCKNPNYMRGLYASPPVGLSLYKPQTIHPGRTQKRHLFLFFLMLNFFLK